MVFIDHPGNDYESAAPRGVEGGSYSRAPHPITDSMPNFQVAQPSEALEERRKRHINFIEPAIADEENRFEALMQPNGADLKEGEAWLRPEADLDLPTSF